MENLADCTFGVSRRGTYNRRAARELHLNGADSRRGTLSSPRRSQRRLGHTVSQGPGPGAQNNDHHLEDGGQLRGHVMRGSPASAQDSRPRLISTSENVSRPNTDRPRSLAFMFEEFLNRQNERGLGLGHGQRELILLGEASPLTFALEEFAQTPSVKNTHQLHDASPHIRRNTNLAVIQQDVHPPHMGQADTAYLFAKGAFTLPSDETANDLVEAYLERFHSSYSIVDKIELEKVHEDRKLPWILLHSVCFVGATFCDASVIHRAGFKSRLEARCDYYQKANVLFDVGYEKSKIILLQCAIMLGFQGPQMHCYWNPCSWVGFGVTLAVSLGIHQSMASSNAQDADKGLLRRLWWTLVVRDTYCSVLLGRPFRINLNQCDTGLLTMDDFSYESTEKAFYQVEVAKLCLILRDIMHCRFGPGHHGVSPESMCTQLENWRSNARNSLEQWNNSSISSSSSLCSIALDILYNYHVCLLYMNHPATLEQRTAPHDVSPTPHERTRRGLLESSARAISAMAITLLTKSAVCDLPHELFPGFFVAGIILYRQKQQKDPVVAQMVAASLDNCRIVLNQARESWDPGNWAMHIFDFLCANCTAAANSNGPAQGADLLKNISNTSNLQQDPPPIRNASEPIIPGDQQTSDFLTGDGSFGPGLETLMPGELAGGIDDYMFMTNFLQPGAEEWILSIQA